MRDHPFVVTDDFARNLERERDEARFDLDFRRELFKLQSNTLESVTAQRDRLMETLDGIKTIAEITEQRDRLAEALKSIASGAVYEAKCISIAREALQSLTPNAEL
jgi:hypothetical protein